MESSLLPRYRSLARRRAVPVAGAKGDSTAGLATLASRAALIGLLALAPARAGTFADFNGDGRSDVFWRNADTGENYLYPLDGLSILDTEGYLRTVADPNWRVVGIGDFDGDGRADLLWRNDLTGDNYIYLMDGTGIAGEGYIRTVASPYWQVAGVGDFDGDGKADILWRNLASGQNYVYPMDGLSIKPGEGYLRTVADMNWTVAGVGDLDGDGKSDILWRNLANGQNYLYPMDGLAIKPGEGFVRTVQDTNWTIAGVGDFDADGRADILWRNAATGENYLYPMNGTQILGGEGYLRTVPDENWRIAAVGDFDGDGDFDILWRNAATGENYLYLMHGASIAAEGYTRTVPMQEWGVIGKTPPAEFEALPVGLKLLDPYIDLVLGTQELYAPWTCSGNPTINCGTGGNPLDPLPRISITRTGYTVTPTADPLVYSLSVQGSVQTVTPSRVRYNTGLPFPSSITCNVSVDTTLGLHSTLTLTGTAVYGRHVPGGPVNRIDVVNLNINPIETADIALSGTNCSLVEFYLPVFIDVLKPYLLDALEDQARLCGAPGAPLFVQCP